jgi:purine-nucleoside phosphorylase
MQATIHREIDSAAEFISENINLRPEFLLILGSGLGDVSSEMRDVISIPYADIPHFPISTAPSHAGNLLIGKLGDKSVMTMQGRLHLYEGWLPSDIAFPIRVAKILGANKMFITNAAGALNNDFKPGDLMIIADHINFTGQNPLVGPHDEAFGLRFPDMSKAYEPKLQNIMKANFQKLGILCESGIYAGILGPSLETSAERRFLRSSGADAVGMSTVMEVIAAKQSGFEVAGISAITNKADGGPDQQPDTIEDVLQHAAIAADKIKKVLPIFLSEWAASVNSG